MSPLLIILIVLPALALFAAMVIVGIYNKLVGLRNRFMERADKNIDELLEHLHGTLLTTPSAELEVHYQKMSQNP